MSCADSEIQIYSELCETNEPYPPDAIGHLPLPLLPAARPNILWISAKTMAFPG